MFGAIFHAFHAKKNFLIRKIGVLCTLDRLNRFFVILSFPILRISSKKFETNFFHFVPVSFQIEKKIVKYQLCFTAFKISQFEEFVHGMS